MPTIYINSSKKILIDESINDFIKSKIKKEQTEIESLEGYNNISFSNDYHNIDLENHNFDDNNLSTFFSDITNNSIDKLDEEAILKKREISVDELQKSRQTDISNIFNK